jgi:ABC-type branched-subunit amino acid transport system permease subunit
MHTRDEVRPAVTQGVAGRPRLLDGLGRTTLMALGALSGCLMLIAYGATVSVCWMIHPLLSALAGVVLGWVVVRVAGKLLWCSARNH